MFQETLPLDFNTILVQLKHELPYKEFYGLDLFQYHTGTIKTTEEVKQKIDAANFNTILVQLKLRLANTLKTLLKGFNTILVQLKLCL